MIYIHIPFCKSRCLYCDFFSSTSSEMKNDFVKALLKEIEGRAEELRLARANTIYRWRYAKSVECGAFEVYI